MYRYEDPLMLCYFRKEETGTEGVVKKVFWREHHGNFCGL